MQKDSRIRPHWDVSPALTQHGQGWHLGLCRQQAGPRAEMSPMGFDRQEVAAGGLQRYH